jgi:hypothetical protein
MLFAALFATVPARPLSAQSHLLAGRAVVRVEGESASVEIDYVVESDGSAAAVSLEGLAFRPTRVESFGASVDGTPVGSRLEVGATGRLTSEVPIAPGRAGEIGIRLAYRVSGAVEGEDPVRLRVPILAIAWPPEEGLPGTFQGEVTLPEGLSVYESFPSGLRNTGPGRYQFDLPAAPALLSMRATRGDRAPLGGIVRVLDAMVLLVLLVLLRAGWRHFRETG